MLIIEGPDGVGKTTLAKELLKQLPKYVYAHFSRLPPGFDGYEMYLDRASRYVVQDRFHLSDIVYATVRGDESVLTPEKYRLVDANLRLLGAYTVIVTADVWMVEERWDKTQMYDKLKTVGAAKEFMRLMECHTHRSPYGGFRDIDIDHHIHCNQGHPYATEDDVTSILIGYSQRQFHNRNLTNHKSRIG